MRRSVFLFFSILSKNLIKGTPIIKNNHIPACKNCKFFTPMHYNDFDSHTNLCQKFGEKNIITGKIEYDFVSSCRKDEEKCGLEGKVFEEEVNLGVKKIKHRLQYHAPIFYLGFLIVSYFSFMEFIRR
jgi:hypothetical protein